MKRIAFFLLTLILLVQVGCSNEVAKGKVETERQAEQEATTKNKDPQLLAYVVDGKVKTMKAKLVHSDFGVTVKVPVDFIDEPLKMMKMLLGDGTSDLQGSSLYISTISKATHEKNDFESIKEDADANYQYMNLEHYPKLKKKYDTYEIYETTAPVEEKPERFVNYLFIKTIGDYVYILRSAMLKEKADENFKNMVETIATSARFPE